MIPIDFNDLTQTPELGELHLSVEASDIGLRGWPETLVVEREERDGVVTLLHFRRTRVERSREREVLWVDYVHGEQLLSVFND